MKTLLLPLGALFLSGAMQLSAQDAMMVDKPASAVATPAAAAPAKPLSRSQEILQRFDKNGDGRIDEDEKADAHDTMQMEQMAKGTPAAARNLGPFQALALELFDRNQDGSVDEKEKEDALAFVRQGNDTAFVDVLLKRFDKNGDGRLDDAERRESQAFAVENRAELAHDVLLKRYDENKDGQLDAAEKAAIKDILAKKTDSAADRVPPGPAALLEKFDQDKDRKLDEAELAAALKFFVAASSSSRAPTPEAQLARLETWKVEIERRRAMRAELGGKPASPDEKKPEIASTPGMVDVDAEIARLNAIKAEIERRRAARGAATSREPASPSTEKK